MKPRVSKEEHSGQGTPECGITWCAWELAEAGERDQGTEEVGKAEAGSCRVPENTGGDLGFVLHTRGTSGNSLLCGE